MSLPKRRLDSVPFLSGKPTWCFPGLNLGGCYLERVLEKGALGTLWLANDTALRRLVGVKVFHGPIIEAATDSETILAEAGSVARLDHPTLSSIYRAGRNEGCVYIVCEHVVGERLDLLLSRVATSRQSQWPSTLSGTTVFSASLPALLQRDSGWSGTIARWGSELAYGLSTAHRRGIIHRAVWPGNIVVARLGSVRLFDFWLGGHASPREVSALHGYLSPEEEAGAEVSASSDVFSLGATLYRGLTGVLPFPIQQTLTEDIVLFDRAPAPLTSHGLNAPRELEKILRRALRIEPSRRYQDIAEMGEALESYYLKTTGRRGQGGGRLSSAFRKMSRRLFK